MKQANHKLKLIAAILTLLIFTFSASTVFADDDNYDVETNGEITALSDSSLEVNGLSFLVTGETMIKNNHGDPINFSDLNIGDVVEVKANVTDAGFTASKIKLEDEPEHNGQLETKGYIESLGDDFLIVNGITLYVDDQTVVKDGDNHISFGDLSEGDFVEVKAHYMDDGTFLSNEIKIEGEHGSGDDDFETEGYIESIGDSSLTVNGMLFVVDENTLIKDHDTIIPFENLSEGDYVEVHAVVLTDTSYLATKIELDDEGGHDGNFETEGFIESLGDSSLVVNGITFYVDENTVIKDHDNPIAFEDLIVGDFVEVKAQLQSDSTFLATEIEREGDHDNNFEIEGYIESKDSSSLVVSGITFFVNDQT